MATGEHDEGSRRAWPAGLPWDVQGEGKPMLVVWLMLAGVLGAASFTIRACFLFGFSCLVDEGFARNVGLPVLGTLVAGLCVLGWLTLTATRRAADGFMDAWKAESAEVTSGNPNWANGDFDYHIDASRIVGFRDSPALRSRLLGRTGLARIGTSKQEYPSFRSDRFSKETASGKTLATMDVLECVGTIGRYEMVESLSSSDHYVWSLYRKFEASIRVWVARDTGGVVDFAAWDGKEWVNPIAIGM